MPGLAREVTHVVKLRHERDASGVTESGMLLECPLLLPKRSRAVAV